MSTANSRDDVEREAVTDGLAVVDHYRSWISNADTKAGALLTLLIAALGVFAVLGERPGSALDGPAWVDWAAGILAVVGSVAVVVAVRRLYGVLRSEIEGGVALGRLDFPHVATAGAEAAPLRPEEVWGHAVRLAARADVKHRSVAGAVPWVLVSLGALVVLALLVGVVADPTAPTVIVQAP